ncbi:MAG: hypothetical protein QOF70_7179 [Acetobacteraceae bacterium]|jgi:hypothetical protein|nr:hypothetical protein [Acetobacteraceae bacterium]
MSASETIRSTDWRPAWVGTGPAVQGGFLPVRLQARKCRERTFGSRSGLADSGQPVPRNIMWENGRSNQNPHLAIERRSNQL